MYMDFHEDYQLLSVGNKHLFSWKKKGEQKFIWWYSIKVVVIRTVLPTRFNTVGRWLNFLSILIGVWLAMSMKKILLAEIKSTLVISMPRGLFPWFLDVEIPCFQKKTSAFLKYSYRELFSFENWNITLFNDCCLSLLFWRPSTLFKGVNWLF